MLDYSEQATMGWLGRETLDGSGTDPLPAVRPIERQGDAPGLLEDLGRLLDTLASQSPVDLSRLLQTPATRTGLSEVLAQVGVARAIRFLHWLDEAGVPDSHLIVAGLIEGDRPEARALRVTITLFTQRQVLTRLLGADRLQALQEATETALKGGA